MFVRIQKWKIIASGALALLVICGFLIWRTSPTHAVTTTSLTGGSDVTNLIGYSSNISDLQVSSTDTNPNVSVKLFVSHGTISMQTTTGLTFYDTNGSALSGQPSSTADLQFSGTMNDVNTALATLQYIRTDAGTGTDTLSASLVQPGEVFFSGNGHLYEYFAGPVTWSQAETDAAASSKYGAQGYLATITSQSENDFILDRLKSDSWIGASDAASEGTWKWVTGPESGEQFWQGNGSGNIVNSMYAHWNNPTTGGTGAEPNNSGGNENCAEFYYSNNGLWNDLNCGNMLGYIVEYGAPGNMPAVSSKDVNITTVTDVTPPTTPGTPTATSPTADGTPTVSWTASTDSGSGLKNPAYTLEWSNSSIFASVSGSTTTNSTSFAPPTSLPDGTWYFRVKATDNSNNTATSGISDAVIIDTTDPTVPGTPSAGVLWTNNNTPTYNWAASTDSGSGLATIAYTVEWSQDTLFSGLGGIAGITGNSYTIPDSLHMADGTWYFRALSTDVLGHNSAWSDYATVHIDTVPPVISNVAATNGATVGKETITWTTDKDTSSMVSYGPTTSLGTSTAETDTGTRIQNHSVMLSNLVACSVYHFTVTSEDIAGNVTTSSDTTFITTGCAGSANVVSHADTSITTSGGGSVNLDTINVHVPTGFAASNADFQVKRINNNPALNAIGNPSGVTVVGTEVYDIKALQNGTTAIASFDKPITITLQYTNAEIAALVESSLAIYRWDAGTGWTKLSDCTVDTTANTVTCTTTNFSTFALYGESKPALVSATSESTSPDGSAVTAVDTTTPAVGQGTGGDGSSHIAAANSQDGSGKTGQKGANASTLSLFLGFCWWLLGLTVVAACWWFLVGRRRRKKQANS